MAIYNFWPLVFLDGKINLPFFWTALEKSMIKGPYLEGTAELVLTDEKDSGSDSDLAYVEDNRFINKIK